MKKIVISLLVILIFLSFVPFNKGILSYFNKLDFFMTLEAAPMWPQDVSDLPPDPDVYFGVLPNGFRYVMMKNDEPKNRMSAHLDISVGSLAEEESERGIAHFLEHMMFNGTRNFNPGELVKYFQSIGMRFGPDANAHTGLSETVYDINLPRNDHKSIKDAFTVLLDYANNALLMPSEVDRERHVILAEKRTRDSASYRSLLSKLSFEFEGSLIPERMPIGSEDVLNKVQEKELRRFYEKWYRPDKMILVVVGSFDIKTVESLILDSFSSLKVREKAVEKTFDIGKVNHKGIKIFYHFDKELGSTSVSISRVVSIAEKNDSLEIRKKEIYEDLVNRMMRSRLNTMITEGSAAFVKADVYSGVFEQRFNISTLSVQCSGNQWEKALSQIENMLRSAVTEKFYDIELERAKKDYLAEIENDERQVLTRDSTQIADDIIYHLNNNRVFQSPGQIKASYGKVIEEASLKDIESTLSRMWENDHRLVEVTVNTPIEHADQSPENRISTVYSESQKQGALKPPRPEEIQFPYLERPVNGGRIKVRKNFEDIGLKRIEFDNNISLNIKKTDFSKNSVLMNMVFGKGRSSEPFNRSGVSLLTQMVVNESGVGTLSKDALEKALSGKNISYSFKVKDEAFMFSAECPTEELELCLHVLYAYLSDFRISDESFRVSVEKLRQVYQKKASTVDGMMEIEGEKFLAGGDQRFGMVPIDVFSRYTILDIENWYLPMLFSEPVEINIVGDYENESIIIEFLSAYFGALDRRDSKKMKKIKPPKFPQSEVKKIVISTEIKKTIASLFYPTDDFWNIKRTRRLNILSDIFTDKMRESIREKFGFSYSQYAYNDPSKAYAGYGVFGVLTYVDPLKSDAVISELHFVAQRLAKGEILEDDLKRAINPVLSEIKKYKRQNDYWLYNVLSGSSEHPEKLEWVQNIEEDYQSISLKEIRSLAKKYLKKRKASILVIGP